LTIKQLNSQYSNLKSIQYKYSLKKTAHEIFQPIFMFINKNDNLNGYLRI